LARNGANRCGPFVTLASSSNGRMPRQCNDARPKGHRFKEAQCAVSLGAFENMDKVKNPKAPAATRVIEGTF